MKSIDPDEFPHENVDSRQPISVELLLLCEEFIRTASTTVHNELRQFLTGGGHHLITSYGWFLDNLAFVTWSHDQAAIIDPRQP